MNTINQTPIFRDWFTRLNDQLAKQRVLKRIRGAIGGNFGDCKPAGDGVWEMRIHYGPGYRMYYAQEGAAVYLLLVGGDKRTQQQDIEKAEALWKAIKKEKSS